MKPIEIAYNNYLNEQKLAYNKEVLSRPEFTNKLVFDDDFNEKWGKGATYEIDLYNRIDIYGRRGWPMRELNYEYREDLLKTLESRGIPKRTIKE